MSGVYEFDFVHSFERMSEKVRGQVRKKCGEVFVDEEHLFNFLCTLCEASFEETGKFFAHVKRVHNNQNSYSSIKQEDPLGPNDESRALRHEPNVQITTIDNAEIILPEYGEESIDSLNSNSNAELRDNEISESEDDNEGRIRYSTRKRTLRNKSDDEDESDCASDSSKKDPTFKVDIKVETAETEKIVQYCGTKPICDKCGKSFARLRNLKRHNEEVNCDQDSEVKKQVFCEYCYKGFSTKRSLEYHQHNRSCTDKNKTDTAKKADNNVSTSSKNGTPNENIEENIDDEVPEKLLTNSAKKPVCNICGNLFASLKSLERHRKEMNCNLNTTFKLAVCEHCGIYFSSKKTLKQHQNSRTCGYNKKPDIEDRSNHNEFDTNDEDPTKCRYCDRYLADSTRRVEHERIHTGERPYQCQICGKCFRTLTNCTLHEGVHSTQRLYKCEICNWAFKCRQTMNTHKQRHGEKKFQCSYCEKLFFYKSERRQHERIHTGEKPYKCTFCEKAFQTSGSLQVHKRIHLNIRPHKCEYCGSCFYTKAMLRNHVVIHTGERPFVCIICNATFSRRKGLKSHEKIHSNVRKCLQN